MASETTMIIDGHSLAFRAFYGTPVDRFMTSQGQHTNAIYGFVAMLLRMLEDHRPDSLAIAFDVSRHSFRTAEYPEYKGTRGATPPEFKGQVPLLQETLQALGITVLQREGFEADDIIATLAARASAAGSKVLVVSGDRDTIQLVNDDVTLLYPASQGVREMKAYDPQGVREKYGVEPHQYRIIAALVGETSDNLPGIPKVGPKTATKWVHEYGSFENIMANRDEIKGVVGQNLRDNAHLAERNYRLNELLRDVPLDVDLTQLRLGTPDAAAVAAAFDRLEFRTLKTRVQKFFAAATAGAGTANAGTAGAAASADYGAAIGAAIGAVGGSEAAGSPEAAAEVDHPAAALPGTWQESESSSAAAGSTVGAAAAARWLPAAQIMPWLEAAATVPAVVLTRYLDEPEVVTVYLAAVPANEQAQPQQEQAALAQTPAAALADTTGQAAETVTADTVEVVAFEWKLGSQEFLKFKNWLAGSKAKTVWSQANQSELDIKVDGVSIDFKLLCQLHRPDLDNSTLVRALANNTELPTPVTGAARAAALAVASQQLLQSFSPAQKQVFTDIEMPLAPVLKKLHERGVAIDQPLLAQQAAQLQQQISQLEERAAQLLGREVSLNSPQQLQTVLFEDLKMPKTRKIKSGYSTDAAAIEQLQAETPHEFLDVLAAHREQQKLKQTVQSLLDEIAADGRIHTRLLQLGAVTGRLSSDRPNLQNIPVRSAAGAQIRRAFVHDSAYEGIFTADYSQIEMRVMAHLSGDAELIAAFNDGEDLHRSVGARVFGVRPEQVTPEMRSRVKAMSYGLAYGLGVFGLAKQLGITQAEAKQLMSDYFVRFGAIRDYLRDVVQTAREQGYTETMFGRRRPFTQLRSPNRILQKNAERAAQNAPIQGTAADIIKRAMIAIEARLQREKLRSRMLLQIHDELMFECAPGERMALELLVREEMAQAAQLLVPLEVSVGFGPNWQAAGH